MPSVCIGPQNIDPSFDPTNDAVPIEQVYHFPSWDAEIDEVCAAACTEANDENTGSTPICIPENFTGQHVTGAIWSPEVEPNCYSWIPWSGLVSDPEHASEIDWNEGTGSPLGLPLSCSLLEDCHEQFDADVSEWIYWWAVGGFLTSIDPETRAAAYSSASKVALSLDMDAGSGPSFDDSQILAGQAEYTAADCGEETCPFYLARFTATDLGHEWDVWLELPGVVEEPKVVGKIALDALHSTMGVWRPATGRVAFLPGSLRMQIQFDVVSNCAQCTGFGDGSYRYELLNPDTVFGTYDAHTGSFLLDYAFPVPSGEAVLQARFEAHGHPPVAGFDLGGAIRCTDPDGYVLSVADSASADSDDDIEYHVWYIDGIPQPNGFAIPRGVHSIDLIVIDSRGAHSRAGERLIDVTVGPACL